MSAWVDPLAVERRERELAGLPAPADLHSARPGAVAVAAEGSGHPALAALRVADETRPWELTGLPSRYSTGELLFISSRWRLLDVAPAGVEGEQ